MLELDLQFGSRVGQAHTDALSPRFVRKWVELALAPSVHQAVMTVRVVGSAEGRALNAQYRSKDYATNVLTFDYAKSPVLMADIVLCAPVVAAEAKTLGKTLAQHYAHLLVHGCLHAQGYDHETSERDAALMESLESLLLLSAAQPDPYLS
ncbi:MAG: rRNA maturation RNase YbeY [Pseudomonadota bacterium]